MLEPKCHMNINVLMHHIMGYINYVHVLMLVGPIPSHAYWVLPPSVPPYLWQSEAQCHGQGKRGLPEGELPIIYTYRDNNGGTPLEPSLPPLSGHPLRRPT